MKENAPPGVELPGAGKTGDGGCGEGGEPPGCFTRPARCGWEGGVAGSALLLPVPLAGGVLLLLLLLLLSAGAALWGGGGAGCCDGGGYSMGGWGPEPGCSHAPRPDTQSFTSEGLGKRGACAACTWARFAMMCSYLLAQGAAWRG